MSKTYYYILMSQKDFLESQVIEEVLRERANYYTSKELSRDFWIINAPKFIDSPEIKNKILSSNFYKQKSKSIIAKLNNLDCEFFSVLITSNFEFIKWIQLRLGYFEEINSISSTTNPSYISDGIFGKFESNNFQNKTSVLDYYPNYLHPDILLNRYKKSLEVYYTYN